jgi:hypothetical protein|tara:strand:+ start:71 stop:283 length:213 start_codon:yes stop_codon:yes gene_type:complete
MATKCVKLRMKDGMSKGAAIKACYPNADSKKRKKISRSMTIDKVGRTAIKAAPIVAGTVAYMKSRKSKKY